MAYVTTTRGKRQQLKEVQVNAGDSRTILRVQAEKVPRPFWMNLSDKEALAIADAIYRAHLEQPHVKGSRRTTLVDVVDVSVFRA
jgi:hypothetical protein